MSAAKGRRKSEPTLNDVLASLGWRSEPGYLYGKRRVFDSDGVQVGHLSADELWSLLRERGLYGKAARP